MCCTVKQTILSTNLESGLCSNKWGTSKVNQVRVWEQSSVNIKQFITSVNIKPFITSVPSLETCYRFLIINSITLFHCGSSLPMSNPYPPDMIHMIDISKPFPFVAILLLLCMFILCKIYKHGRPGNEATLHQHNNLMLHE